MILQYFSPLSPAVPPPPGSTSSPVYSSYPEAGESLTSPEKSALHSRPDVCHNYTGTTFSVHAQLTILYTTTYTNRYKVFFLLLHFDPNSCKGAIRKTETLSDTIQACFKSILTHRAFTCSDAYAAKLQAQLFCRHHFLVGSPFHLQLVFIFPSPSLPRKILFMV